MPPKGKGRAKDAGGRVKGGGSGSDPEKINWEDRMHERREAAVYDEPIISTKWMKLDKELSEAFLRYAKMDILSERPFKIVFRRWNLRDVNNKWTRELYDSFQLAYLPLMEKNAIPLMVNRDDIRTDNLAQVGTLGNDLPTLELRDPKGGTITVWAASGQHRHAAAKLMYTNLEKQRKTLLENIEKIRQKRVKNRNDVERHDTLQNERDKVLGTMKVTPIWCVKIYDVKNLSDEACNQEARNGGLHEFKETIEDQLSERANRLRRAAQYGKEDYMKAYEESMQLTSSNTPLSRVLNCEQMMRSLSGLLMFGDHFRRGLMFKVSRVSSMIQVYGGFMVQVIELGIRRLQALSNPYEEKVDERIAVLLVKFGKMQSVDEKNPTVVELKELRETVRGFQKMEFDMWKGDVLKKIDEAYLMNIHTVEAIGFKTNEALKEISDYSADVEKSLVPYLKSVTGNTEEEEVMRVAFVNRIKLELQYLPGDEEAPMPLMTNQFLEMMALSFSGASDAIQEVSEDVYDVTSALRAVRLLTVGARTSLVMGSR
ncbi:hypothetical protein AcV7_007198 [Taiwanofungus camphoratus]|nr:hypothetical protein AcV7_007198 [Antrodia cinnamomea]